MAKTSYRTLILPSGVPHALEVALHWLGGGDIIAFPTDTVYGLGAPMDRVDAVRRLYRVKGRPLQQPVPLLLAEVDDVERVCQRIPAATWRLAERFWPGGLTLVLQRRLLVPALVTAGQPSVAVRLPAHPLPRELARRVGVPLAASSANRSGAPAPVTAEEVQTQLGGRIPLILDGGVCAEAQASTIVDLTSDPPRLLRLGPISRTQVEAVVGPVLQR